MTRRTMLEQELYEQFIDEGVDQTTADLVAREQAAAVEPPFDIG